MKLMTFAVLWAATIASTAQAQVHPLAQLIEAARGGPSSPGLEDLITQALTSKGGTAVWGEDYLFVPPSSSPPTVSIDAQPPVLMVQVGHSNLWMRLVKMRVGVTHSYQFFAMASLWRTDRTWQATIRTPIPNPESRKA